MTGWRLGGAVGPKELVEGIAKLSVNDESCSNHFVQYAGLEALTLSPALNFINVGERTNVTGSAIFRRLRRVIEA